MQPKCILSMRKPSWNRICVKICMLVLCCCANTLVLLYRIIYIFEYTSARRNVVEEESPIFCIFSIRDGCTKWVRYRIIVELQLFSFQYCWLSMLGIVEERWESCLFFSSVFKGQILSVNVILTRSNLVPIKNKTVLANGLKQHN